ncbi:WcaI family glycosyltransferase [Cognatiluteimonas profundi]|uniref:WcaI family glycosyltransferase n=1 Tax=Cognatiluteimonas profundi TaxID=2594501 RepID=UPI001E3AD4EE|nr:WcaI family glycosyltransferase [Lysobacter profundi]
MSRILVVGINFAPETIGTGKYTGELCEWLAARGHRVRVVTAPPYYPAWKLWKGYGGRWFRRTRWHHVSVIRCPVWVPRKPSGITRLLHLASFALSSFAAMLWCIPWRPQVVINIAPTLASAPAAWALSRLVGARNWLHVQDFEVDAAMDMGIVNAGILRRLALAAESWMLRRFDRVSAISWRMCERLGAKGVPEEQQVLFPNWVDTDAIHPLAGPSPYRAELGIPDDAIVALYSGNMGLKQGLDILSDAAKALSLLPQAGVVHESSLLPPAGEGARRADEGALRNPSNHHSLLPSAGEGRNGQQAVSGRADEGALVGRPIDVPLLPQTGVVHEPSGAADEGALRNPSNHHSLLPPAGEGARRADEGALQQEANSPPPIHFIFGGEGPARPALEAACAHLPNVRFLDLQPTERLNDWLGLADIHLMPQRADVADLVMPSKLTGMLASGRAILATASCDSGIGFALMDCGVITPPGNTAAFVAALQALAGDNARRIALGHAARTQALATLSRDAVLLTFEQHLNTLLGITPDSRPAH